METATTRHIELSDLSALPMGLLLRGPDGRVEWANDVASELLGVEAEKLRGAKPSELAPETHALLEGDDHHVSVSMTQRWLQRNATALEGGGHLLTLIDVSTQEMLAAENVRLQKQVEDLRLTDELTGLPNKRAISQALELHISRSRRYHNPLSVVLAQLDWNDQDIGDAAASDNTVLAVSRFLRDRLRWVDQIARWEPNTFLLVLPETTVEDARGLVDKIDSDQASFAMPDVDDAVRPVLHFGLACWSKGNDMRILLRTALQDLRRGLGDQPD